MGAKLHQIQEIHGSERFREKYKITTHSLKSDHYLFLLTGINGFEWSLHLLAGHFEKNSGQTHEYQLNLSYLHCQF